MSTRSVSVYKPYGPSLVQRFHYRPAHPTQPSIRSECRILYHSCTTNLILQLINLEDTNTRSEPFSANQIRDLPFLSFISQLSARQSLIDSNRKEKGLYTMFMLALAMNPANYNCKSFQPDQCTHHGPILFNWLCMHVGVSGVTNCIFLSPC